MEIDLLERCRAGDREAFRGLVALWGDSALRTALVLSGDRVRAEEAVREAFLGCWAGLPSFHSERAFRPWLMGAVARAAVARAGTPPSDGHRACLAGLDPTDRVAAVLHSFDGYGPAEVALATGASLPATARRLRGALRVLRACLGTADARAALAAALGEDARGVELATTFYADRLRAAIPERAEIQVRRLVASDPRHAWANCAEPATLAALTAATGVLVRGPVPARPGTRIVARAPLADRRRAREEHTVTRVEPERMLAWTTRARLAPLPGAIELRRSIEVVPAEGGCEARYRLHGVAFPDGASGRWLRAAYAKVADGMHGSMHRGLERLAALIESRR